MSTLKKALGLSIILAVSPVAMAESEKDCLLKGTVHHGDQAGADATQVKITSVSRYDSESRCKVRRDRKMEFKLPADPRLQDAPEGSEVQYRYRTDERGESEAELLSVGA